MYFKVLNVSHVFRINNYSFKLYKPPNSHSLSGGYRKKKYSYIGNIFFITVKTVIKL